MEDIKGSLNYYLDACGWWEILGENYIAQGGRRYWGNIIKLYMRTDIMKN